MVTHKDCEEWAAMIAQMQDDPSWHPKWNPKGVKQVKAKRGPNDLEEIIERLEFRNDVLHKANQKQQDEILSKHCLLYTSPSPRDRQKSRMPSSA